MPIIGFDNLDIATKSSTISSKTLATWDGPSARYTPVAGDRVTRVEFYGGTDAADVGRIALQVISTGMLVCKTDVYYTPGTGKRWNSVDVDYDLSPYEGEELRVVFMFTGSALTEDPYFSTNVLPDDLAAEVRDLYASKRANPNNADWPDWYTGSFIGPSSLGAAPVRMVVENSVPAAPVGPTLSGKLKRRNGVPVINTSGLVITVSTAQGGASIIPASTISTNAAGDWTFTNPDALAYATQYWVTIAKADGSETFVGMLSTQADPGV